MYNKFISDEQNKILEILEWTNCRLMEANDQLRGARANNLDERTIRYFDDKIDFYKECRTDLTQEVYTNYAKEMLVAEKNVSKMQTILWGEFKRRYPDCKKTFEDVFKNGMCYYKPFIQDFSLNTKAPIPTFKNLNDAFVTYTIVAMEKEKLESFYNLYNGIHSEVGEYGAKPFVYRTLDESLIGVPIWAINEINNAIIKQFPKAKKAIVKHTMEVQKLRTKLSRDPNNKDLAKEYNQAYDALENCTRMVEQYEKVAYCVQNPAARIKNATNRGAFSGMVNRGYEIFSELVLGVPKNIRKLSIKRERIICHKQEIDDIVDAAKYCLQTAEAAMALNAYMGKETEFELFNYEYSKKLIKQILKSESENDMQMRDFKRDLAILIDNKPEVREAKQDVVSQIKDVKKGYETARFNTPFGLVAYQNKKLVNVHTKEEFPVSKLDEYVYDGKSLIYKVDENNAILGIKKYDEMERELSNEAKLATIRKQVNLTK